MKNKIKVKKIRAVKDQFVLNVGDDGAILSFFRSGKLENRVFIDSPDSDDLRVLEKLFLTYKSIPIVMLVDVIEQTYSQQILPPVSPMGIKQQIQKRIKRDFQPNDLSNVIPLGRSKEGRKDWNFLFVSLANTDPFAKWLEFVLNQKNKFKGVYLLPIESVKLFADLNRGTPDSAPFEWEILVLHNKLGGFRIVVVKNGKLAFTRLAQNLVGDNIADIIVGSLEQEVANTVEYLKRFTFKGEQYSKITIIISAEVIAKIDPKSFKFGKVVLMTPHQASEKVGLPVAVTEQDKFSDIFSATHFASYKSHQLKFSSIYTRKLEMLYNGIKASYIGAAVMSVLILSLSISEFSEIMNLRKQRANLESDYFAIDSKLRAVQEKESKLPSDYKKMREVLEISRLLPKDQYSAYKIIESLQKVFLSQGNGRAKYLIQSLDYKRLAKSVNTTSGQAPSDENNNDKFELIVDFELSIPEIEKDRLESYNKKFEADIKEGLKGYEVNITKYPEAQTSNQFEKVGSGSATQVGNQTILLPGIFKVSGVVKP